MEKRDTVFDIHRSQERATTIVWPVEGPEVPGAGFP